MLQSVVISKTYVKNCTLFLIKYILHCLLQASELTSGKLREVVQAHRYLHFPRLSSRALFDELCPKESIRSLRRLVNLFYEC